jgi:hypothetical protein
MSSQVIRGMVRWGATLVVMVLLGACSGGEPDIIGVPYPNNYRSVYIHYATVDRKDGTIRDLYIHPDSLARLRLRQPLPEGTILVIESYAALRDTNGDLLRDEDGRFIRDTLMRPIHVAEKRFDWRDEDFESGRLSEDWNFGSFDAESTQPYDESLTACFNCHNSASRTDFVWSLELLFDYQQTQVRQYFYCDLSARTACDFP